MLNVYNDYKKYIKCSFVSIGRCGHTLLKKVCYTCYLVLSLPTMSVPPPEGWGNTK